MPSPRESEPGAAQANRRCPYLIGPPYVSAMDVPMEFTQDEAGSASFGISRSKRLGQAGNPPQF